MPTPTEWSHSWSDPDHQDQKKAAPLPSDENEPSDNNKPADHDEIRELVGVVVDAADDKLGQRTDAFFVGDVLGITDWFVVTAGSNSRQVRAIVDNIEEQLTLTGGPKPLRIEGKDSLNWVLMDYGVFVVHVFDSESREYYELERLWADVPRLRESA